jgi:hypothetical protein
MPQHAHFWLRLFGLVVILALEFGPRLWTNSGASTSARVTAAVVSAR